MLFSPLLNAFGKNRAIYHKSAKFISKGVLNDCRSFSSIVPASAALIKSAPLFCCSNAQFSSTKDYNAYEILKHLESIASNKTQSDRKVVKSHQAPKIENSLDSEFGRLGLSSNISTCLNELGFVSPTPAQKEVIPKLLLGDNVVIASRTGSGKTLAFLLPTFQKLLQQEADGYQRRKGHPRVLVLAPTRELSEQILAVIKSISHHVKISSTSLIGGESFAIQRKSLDRIVDVVVASPSRLLEHKKMGNVRLSHVHTVIVDEVDTMLTQGFGNDIKELFTALAGQQGSDGDLGLISSSVPLDAMLSQGASNNNVSMLTSMPLQYVFSSATLTKSVRSLLQEAESTLEKSVLFDPILPENVGDLNPAKRRNPFFQSLASPSHNTVRMQIVEVDGLHKTLPNVKYLFEDCKGRDKLVVLREILQQHGNLKRKTLIFCNTVPSCRAVMHSLEDAAASGFGNFAVEQVRSPEFDDDLELESSRSSASRFASCGLFTVHGELSSDQRLEQLNGFRNYGKGGVLVSTDLAARGIDIPDLDHIILFDFPYNSIDFLHRTGRCGRGGRPGRVTSLLSKPDLVLAQAIEGAIRRDLPIDSLSSSKKFYEDRGKLAAVVGRMTRRESYEKEVAKRKLVGALASDKKGTMREKSRAIAKVEKENKVAKERIDRKLKNKRDQRSKKRMSIRSGKEAVKNVAKSLSRSRQVRHK